MYIKILIRLCLKDEKMKIWICTNIYFTDCIVSRLTIFNGNPEVPFLITLRCREACYSFLWIASLILDLYLIKLY